MTRSSDNYYQDGRLWDGYDYENQAWVKDGKYVSCGHPESMNCICYGRLHVGEDTKRLNISKPDRVIAIMTRWVNNEISSEQADRELKVAGIKLPVGFHAWRLKTVQNDNRQL